MSAQGDELFLGIDIGSVTVKTALMDNEGTIVFSSYKKHGGSPFAALLETCKELLSAAPNATAAALVTGSGRALAAKVLGIESINEIMAQATAAHWLCPSAKTIIEIGGQDSKFIRLAHSQPGKAVNILTQRMNDLCAAGTGAFIEQQAERMNLSLSDFCKLALRAKHPASIAGRCAVFSKTDIIHLEQQGTEKEDIAAGICDAVVRNYSSAFAKGKTVEKPILFQGGVAANLAVAESFKRLLGLDDSDFLISDFHKISGSIGAALLAKEKTDRNHLDISGALFKLSSQAHFGDKSKSKPDRYAPLLRGNYGLHWEQEPKSVLGKARYLGIDIGSTSICAAVLDENKTLIARHYALKKDDLLQSVAGTLASIEVQLKKGGNSDIRGAGVTGSGRHLVASLLGADTVKDEISAQLRAALHMEPQTDTIIEIGGQDSKYLYVKNGRLMDFEMNKVCAAGTGHFLQEQAKRLQVPLERLGELALKSESPCNLGTRCTVFMESDIINFQQAGISKQDIAAGLSYAIARNYLEKTVCGKPIGGNILFLGGVARNPSVVAAFRELLGKPIWVPDHHDVSAAIGMALFAAEEKGQKPAPTKFLGFDALNADFTIAGFQCKECANSCRINRVQGYSRIFFYGGLCDRYDRKKIDPPCPNFLLEREKALLGPAKMSESESKRKPIGIPRCHLNWELFPLYKTFLWELGFEPILSEPTSRQMVYDGVARSTIDNCFACKIVYGHIFNLKNKGIRDIFYPSISEFRRRKPDLKRNHACPHVQAMPDLLRQVFPECHFISPSIYRDRSDQDWKQEFIRVALSSLGASPETARKAVAQAERAQNDFDRERENIGKKLLENGKYPHPRIGVIMGKPYNVCDPHLNLNVAKKLNDFGVWALPYDCLPLSSESLTSHYADMIWHCGQDLIRAALIVARHPNLFPIVITNFGCGPDSYILKFLAAIFAEKPMLVLEVDEHTSDIGIVTRMEAFLNNITATAILDKAILCRPFKPFVAKRKWRHLEKLLYVPWGFDSYRAIAAAFQSIGIRAKMLPRHDAETERLGRMYSSGRECLPYIMHVGDAVRMLSDPEFDPNRSALYMPASDLACRVSLFSTSMGLVLRRLGFAQVPVIAPRLSMDNDEVTRVFGISFAKNVFRGMLGIELLTMILPHVRPYEKQTGKSDEAYETSVQDICESLATGDFYAALSRSIARFNAIPQDRSIRRSVIGLVGDDYTRGNEFANRQFIRHVEAMGGEVRAVPIWSTFLEFQMNMKPQKSFCRNQWIEFAVDKIKQAIGHADIRKMSSLLNGSFPFFPGPDFEAMLHMTRPYLSPRSEPLTIMALAHVLRLLRERVDGIANLVGFQCMIHSIVGANLQSLLAGRNVPYLSLLFDFQENIHHQNRLEAFMMQVKQKKQIPSMELPAAFLTCNQIGEREEVFA